jgi:hypothetical protein
MRWRGRRASQNVEDRRGKGGGKKMIGGGMGTILILLVVWFLGGNPLELLGLLTGGNSPVSSSQPYQPTAEEDELAQFVSVVLADCEDVWSDIFRQNGAEYRKPKLVLYTGMVQSACGTNSAATGPFYCPGDEKIYIDLSFYKELQEKFHAPGDFAMAYVLAHEVGHHVQNLLGTSGKVMRLRNQMSKTEFNQYLVRLELQADFYAGVWAHHAQKQFNILEEGDIDEAMNAASAVGDDRIQKQSQGYVVPDAFTHGTSEQRKRWFLKGYRSGDIRQGDTFAANEL